MNSHTKETLERCAREAGAIRPCSLCGNDVYVWDDDADRMTYAMATNAWKAGDSGFRGMWEAAQVSAVVKQFLESVDERCPRCSTP